MNILGDLPKDVITAYNRAMKRRFQGNDRTKLELAIRAFKWLVCAQRHLKLQEVMEAVVLNPDDETFPRHRVHYDEGQYLLDACGNLVVYDPESDVLTFAHSTVPRYLLGTGLNERGSTCDNSQCENWSSTLPAPPVGGQWAYDVKVIAHFSLEEAGRYVCELCLTYLSFKDFDAQLVRSRVALDVNPLAIGHTFRNNAQSRVLYRAAALLRRPLEGSSAQSKQIDLNRLLRNQLNSGPDANQAYILLDYVKQYWLFHTAALEPINHSDPCDARLWRIYKYLVYERRTTFTFLPWEGESFRNFLHKDVRTSASIQWAAYHENLSLLYLLLENGETLHGYPKDKPQPILLAWQHSCDILMLHFIESGYFRPIDAWPRNKNASITLSMLEEVHAPKLSSIEQSTSILFEEAAQHFPEALPTLLDSIETSEAAYLEAFAYCVTGHKEEAALNLLKQKWGRSRKATNPTMWNIVLALAIWYNDTVFLAALRNYIHERGMDESELDAALEDALDVCVGNQKEGAKRSNMIKYRGFVSVLRACPNSLGAMARFITKYHNEYPVQLTGLFIPSTPCTPVVIEVLDLSVSRSEVFEGADQWRQCFLHEGSVFLHCVLNIVKYELRKGDPKLPRGAINVLGIATCYMPLLALFVKTADEGKQFDMQYIRKTSRTMSESSFSAFHGAWMDYVADLEHLVLPSLRRSWSEQVQMSTSGMSISGIGISGARTARESIADWIHLSNLILTLKALLPDLLSQNEKLECRIWMLLNATKSLSQQPLDLRTLYPSERDMWDVYCKVSDRKNSTSTVDPTD